MFCIYNEQVDSERPKIPTDQSVIVCSLVD